MPNKKRLDPSGQMTQPTVPRLLLTNFGPYY